MNWRRGLFRLSLLASGVWMMSVALSTWQDIRHFDERHPIKLDIPFDVLAPPSAIRRLSAANESDEGIFGHLVNVKVGDAVIETDRQIHRLLPDERSVVDARIAERIREAETQREAQKDALLQGRVYTFFFPVALWIAALLVGWVVMGFRSTGDKAAR